MVENIKIITIAEQGPAGPPGIANFANALDPEIDEAVTTEIIDVHNGVVIKLTITESNTQTLETPTAPAGKSFIVANDNTSTFNLIVKTIQTGPIIPIVPGIAVEFLWIGTSWIINGINLVTSVNTKIGDVVLDPDDLDDAETTNKFTTSTELSKLAGIEANATEDQTDVEIKTAYENNLNTNEFDDDEKIKLAGIEANATEDQTDVEIKTAYENNLDTNEFDDDEKIKLAGIEANATEDQTDVEIKTAYENNLNTNEFDDDEKIKLAGIEAGSGTNVVDSVNTQIGHVVLKTDDIDDDLEVHKYVNDNELETIEDSRTQFSTGLLNGGDLEISLSSSELFNVNPGEGFFVDNNTTPGQPVRKRIVWDFFPTQTITNLATQPVTVVGLEYVDPNIVIIQQAEQFNAEDSRSIIQLGILIHQNNLVIDGVFPRPSIINDVQKNLEELARFIMIINVSGNIFKPKGSSLKLIKSPGETFNLGINHFNNKNSPNSRTDPNMDPVTFSYVYQDGAGGFIFNQGNTDIDGSNYDDGSGTLASMTGVQFQIQRIWFFTITNETIIHYGQATYQNIDDAVAAINTEDFNFAPALTDGFRCWLLLRTDTSQLSNPVEAKFILAGRFGDVLRAVT